MVGGLISDHCLLMSSQSFRSINGLIPATIYTEKHNSEKYFGDQATCIPIYKAHLCYCKCTLPKANHSNVIEHVYFEKIPITSHGIPVVDTMISRREQLLIRPWEEQRYNNHKRKVRSAKPAVDVKSPAVYNHVTTKLKKIQTENERLENIRKENVRLLQRLGEIMRKKRLEDFWKHPRPNFLNREKIIFNRPKTCKGRIQTTDSDATLPVQETPLRPRGRSAVRCNACSGRPVKNNQVIPEERIPWKPPRKSWNVKIYTEEFQTHRCCTACCRE